VPAISVDTTTLVKIGEGREAEMFAWEGGTILRLLRGTDRRNQVQWEAAAMETARARGLPVPAVFGITEVMGRPGIIMERVDGPDLLTQINARPWTIFQAGSLLGDVHARLHSVTASERLPMLKPTLAARIGSRPEIPPELARFAIDSLNDLPEGDRICHFDYHPANVLISSAGPVVIDWTNVKRGDHHADVARSVLILRLGEPPPGSVSAVMKVLIRFARGILLGRYLSAYHRREHLDRSLVDRWIPVCAVDRLLDGIPEEVPAIHRLLRESGAPLSE
jgi:aminoglycoside phosphotransferase (APT) family kinase protein